MEIDSKDYIDVHKIEDNNTWRKKIYDWLGALQANTLLTSHMCISHKQLKIFNGEGSHIYSVFGFGGSLCSCYGFKYYFLFLLVILKHKKVPIPERLYTKDRMQ